MPSLKLNKHFRTLSNGLLHFEKGSLHLTCDKHTHRSAFPSQVRPILLHHRRGPSSAPPPHCCLRTAASAPARCGRAARRPSRTPAPSHNRCPRQQPVTADTSSREGFSGSLDTSGLPATTPRTPGTFPPPCSPDKVCGLDWPIQLQRRNPKALYTQTLIKACPPGAASLFALSLDLLCGLPRQAVPFLHE